MAAVEFPAPAGLLSTSTELAMPFSDAVKYCILGISVLLLLVALSILAWQIFRCFSQTHTLNPHQDTVSSELLHSDEKTSTAGNYSAAPGTKLEDVRTKADRLSRCLSLASFPPELLQTDQDTREDQTTGRVCGSLRFSIFHDQLQSRLVVTLLQAEGLLDPARSTSLQPFVNVRLMLAAAEQKGLKGEEMPPGLWTVLQEWRSRIVKGSCSPVFGDQFGYILQKNVDELPRIHLRMEVRDFDKFSRHTVLGEVRVPLGQLSITHPLELQEDLRAPQKDLVGEVLLSLRLLPTSQRLEVGLLKVRMALTETSSETALYARISVQCNQNKLRYQKTSAVPCSPVTIFNETSGKSNKHLAGRLSVGKERSSEDEHWTLMLRSVRQPVAKWHLLLI
ncbi:synaptotagmin-1 isoform X2 [Nothobranchius furzeri]|uniref:Transcript variant X2 n=1 Tax=Nothobranchius furzeri TaxID=105023 RepID=A0A9D2YQX1_NOTFU|nr:transcript variant X2 [Nothobranchius furzeri]